MVAKISLSGVILFLIHLGVLVINSTCEDKRNSGNHDIICIKLLKITSPLDLNVPFFIYWH